MMKVSGVAPASSSLKHYKEKQGSISRIGTMAKKKGKNNVNSSVGPSDRHINRGRSDLGCGCSAPEPEEAHRLIRSFMNISRASIREAIVSIVTELSARNDKRQ
jgi:hypothetical protein